MQTQHPALLGVNTTQGVSKMRPHLKMLCNDLYTYSLKANYQGGSPHCRLCQEPSADNTNSEDIQHILTSCRVYDEVRSSIFQEMENICSVSPSQVQFQEIVKNQDILTQFILDCTSLNLKSRINVRDNAALEIFSLSRDLCFSITKTRMQKLKEITES